MDLPDRITIQLQCDQSDALGDLIVKMTVYAGTKNLYHIYFPKTDPYGRAELTADEFRGQFADHWEQGLMDYNGTGESASQHVKLELFDPANMRANLESLSAWPLLKNEAKRWASRREMIEYFLSCRNGFFRSARRSRLVEIPADGALSFTVAQPVR